jgi:hypothetical protein
MVTDKLPASLAMFKRQTRAAGLFQTKLTRPPSPLSALGGFRPFQALPRQHASASYVGQLSLLSPLTLEDNLTVITSFQACASR